MGRTRYDADDLGTWLRSRVTVTEPEDWCLELDHAPDGTLALVELEDEPHDVVETVVMSRCARCGAEVWC